MVNGKNKTRSNLGGIAVTGMDDNGVINKTSGNVGTDEQRVGYDAVERQTPEPWLMLTLIGTRFQIGRGMR